MAYCAGGNPRLSGSMKRLWSVVVMMALFGVARGIGHRRMRVGVVPAGVGVAITMRSHSAR
ncbi:hypothetical protein [Pseudobythopirellula maris]|uniref:hypothetical protein n=1 Tax=Pseudobythopirellula maris TaxID=2527991 RepID=UPI0018D27B8D|nr:hypothetical protein [Pseudobythopirellula maris]